ncbi:hypothetical protein ACMD2_01290 [Ananas comosus]|uniref:Thioredoxin-like fold domain-containing protein MRL7L, chloroplastic n=1 Tax=Ananas comosus TaxID=4615 RepID=A0A199VA16_ANACO|nr:hypothetical protein ACMD2_01290 [Ananas comosus]
MALHYPLLTRCSTLCLTEAPTLLRSHPPLPPSRAQPRNPSGFRFSLACSSGNKHFPQKPPGASSKALDLVLGRDRNDDEDDDDDDDTDSSDEDEDDAPFLMSAAERAEMRRSIRAVLDANPEVAEETDPVERRAKARELLEKYPLVVEEDDPDWPEDADGRGFNLDQFFNKVTIKHAKKENDDDEDDDGYDSDKQIVWQDDDYIRPIRDISAVDWEDTVFKDFNPLIILVHNRYKRPKENEKARNELEKAVQMFWQAGLPSPRCVAIDACVEHDLVSALKISLFPEILFTKAGKILHREKVARTADEWSKIMAFFYYKAARPPCLAKTAGQNQEKIPSLA